MRTASNLSFNHRIDMVVGDHLAVGPRGESRPFAQLKTDTGRVLRIVKSQADVAIFDVIDDQSGLRGRIDLANLFDRSSMEFLDHIGAASAEAQPGNASTQSENPAPAGEGL